MSLDQQVALARLPRSESSHLSKAARQAVPPFLQKLYEIVNDPRNDELIRWSENGDSFYVLNHERFAREVLGRWFKHQKFTSFVRQLNMYGFHKIPHLQQGVLKSDTDTEPWNFEHPHFHRGQPDLLCLIQRKKQPANNNSNVDDDFADSMNPSAPLGNTNSQVLDVNSIVHGIAAIKRHQQAISADLNALKKSNDLLWEEATLTRQRHDKHQDTINRILKFLAGVFGQNSDSIHKDDGGRSPGVVPRARQRLMIGDGGRFPKGKTVEVTDVDDDDGDVAHAVHSQEGTNIPLAGQLASLDSPTMSSSSTAPETPSPASVDSTPTRPAEVLSRAGTGNHSNHGSTTELPVRTAPAASVNISRADTLTPSILSAAAASMHDSGHADNMWQAAIQQVLSNPVQMQRLMQALSTQQNHPLAAPSDPPSYGAQQSAQITPYNAAYNDYNRYRSDLSVPNAPLPLLSTTSSGDDVMPFEPLLDNASRLEASYRDAMDIEADMDVLQTSLNSLINDLGIDPQTLTAQALDREHSAVVGGASLSPGNSINSMHTPGLSDMHSAKGMHPNSMHIDAARADPSLLPPLDHTEDSNSDSFLESLLNGMSSSDPSADYSDVTSHYDPSTRIDGTSVADASTEQLTAFLDEVQSDTAPSPLSSSIPKPQKRKSDVAGISLPTPTVLDSMAAGPKTKRKR